MKSGVCHRVRMRAQLCVFHWLFSIMPPSAPPPPLPTYSLRIFFNDLPENEGVVAMKKRTQKVFVRFVGATNWCQFPAIAARAQRQGTKQHRLRTFTQSARNRADRCDSCTAVPFTAAAATERHQVGPNQERVDRTRNLGVS